MAEEQLEDQYSPRPETLRERMDEFCANGILGLMLAILAFGVLAYGGVYPGGFLVIQGMTMLVLALWAVRLWTQRHQRLLWPPTCWAVVIFMFYAIVRCQWVDIPSLARVELIRVVVYGILFLAIVNNLNRRRSALIITVTLIGLAFGESLAAILQYVSHYPKIWTLYKVQYLDRGSGTYFNPNHLAGLLDMTLPLALTFAMMSRFTHVKKVLFGYAFFVMLAGLAVTLSRGGMIASGLGLGVFFAAILVQRRNWAPAALALLVVAAVIIGIGSQMSHAQGRFAETVSASGKIDDTRFLYWKPAREMFLKNVRWGVGPGHFDAEFPQFRPYGLIQLQADPLYVHNDYLNTLCDWGVVGMLIIGFTFVMIGDGVFRVWRFVRRSPEAGGSGHNVKAAVVFGGSIGLLALMVHSVVDFNMQIPANAIIAVTLMAMLTAHWRYATEGFWANPHFAGRVALTGMAAIGLAFLGWQGWHKAREVYWSEAARHLPDRSPALLNALTNACAAEPDNYMDLHLVGEYYRRLSWTGEADYKAQAEEALKWFGRSMDANRHYAMTPVRYGMCLDWLDRTNQATFWFNRALELDPAGYIVLRYEGWHQIELENYPAARDFLIRSLSIYPEKVSATSLPASQNYYARDLLNIVNERLAKQAAQKK